MNELRIIFGFDVTPYELPKTPWTVQDGKFYVGGLISNPVALNWFFFVMDNLIISDDYDVINLNDMPKTTDSVVLTNGTNMRFPIPDPTDTSSQRQKWEGLDVPGFNHSQPQPQKALDLSRYISKIHKLIDVEITYIKDTSDPLFYNDPFLFALISGRDMLFNLKFKGTDISLPGYGYPPLITLSDIPGFDLNNAPQELRQQGTFGLTVLSTQTTNLIKYPDYDYAYAIDTTFSALKLNVLHKFQFYFKMFRDLNQWLFIPKSQFLFPPQPSPFNRIPFQKLVLKIYYE